MFLLHYVLFVQEKIKKKEAENLRCWKNLEKEDVRLSQKCLETSEKCFELCFVV